jgi:hypothetical protein
MPFDKSCFISYRQRPVEEYKETIADFHQVLETELLYKINLDPYVDPQRADNDFVNRALAATLCKSVCMVVLYIPTYFDLNYYSCAREYKAMEDLEEERMALLGHTNKKTHGLIIPVIYRGWDDFPAAIKNERTCYNIQPYTLGKRIRNNRKVRVEFETIATYVYARYLELNAVRPDPCSNCPGFNYPNDARTTAWLAALNAPPMRNELPRA